MPDQFERRVLVEHHHQVDRLERRQHFGARLLVRDRPTFALEPARRGVAVEPDHQPVAAGACLGQHLDVTRVNDVEAAVGEADAQALAPPFGQAVVEHRPVEYDLLFRRQGRGRQDARAQLGGGHHRGAALAHHHRRRRVGGAHGRLEAGAHGEQRAEHGHDGIAGARHVAHVDRVGGHVDRRLAAHHERHAVLAPRHQHSGGRGRGDIGVGQRGAPRGVGQLLAVRRDQGRAAIDGEVSRLGIDHHRLAELGGGFDDRAHHALGQRPLGVVGEHHRARLGQGRDRVADHRVLDLARDRLCHFPIGAQHVGRLAALAGDEADLARRRPRAVDHQAGLDVGLGGERRAHGARAVVVADHADEQTTRAERGDVARDVAGAADHRLLARHRNHRRWRLGRDARDVAVDELVEHEVADAKHRPARNRMRQSVKIEHRYLLGCAVSGNDRRNRGNS